MSFTRYDYFRVYSFAKEIYKTARGKDNRREAKAIAMMAEAVIGQQDSQPAETWEVK